MPGNSRAPGATRVLGIDPGSRKAGWGVIDVDIASRKVRHVDNGVIFLDEDAPLTGRLVALSKALHEVLESFRPDVAAVEDVFVQKGARSALILGQARGAALATLGLCSVSVVSHTTSQVKARVTGRGRATKHQVAEMVCLALGLKEHPFEDAADALAVALCHALDHTSGVALPPPPVRRRGGTRSRREGLVALARSQGKI